MICPVCRSQNMDSAKFCGNCGNPFTRSPETTSSLINCPQGHLYSSIYQYCPYCPQPEIDDDASTYITRVEESGPPPTPDTAVASAVPYVNNDFATLVDNGENLIETLESPSSFRQSNILSSTSPAATEVIPSLQSYEQKSETSLEKDLAAIDSFPTMIDETPAIRTGDSAKFSSAPLYQVKEPAPIPPVEQAKAPPPAEADRQTMIMKGEEIKAPRGKIVGWLISYTRDPDGEDFRVFSGYNRMGANPVCDIVIEDETVSGSHAILVYRDGRCLIKDDLSRNGTFVNGKEITEAYPLKSYDQIRVGNTILTFVSSQRLA
jgi:Inner membrane component of T3SS, cytoplasmic domain